jgi:glycosyltransferase involved in cell wall biosynthesis/acetyltransferase-like isoleucine patch superfamily enzyme
MRITIVTGSFYSLPPAPCGSVERLWHDLGLEFARRGHEVTFVARGDPDQPQDQVVGNVRYIRRSYWNRTGSRILDVGVDFLYSARMTAHLPEADILVANLFWLPVFAALRPSRGRIVVILHRHPKGQLPLYGGAARLAAVSHAVKDAVAQQSSAALAITKVIPNFFDVTAFVPPAIPRSFDGEQVILYSGRLHPEKGLHLLIDAFAAAHAEYPQLRLRLIGPIAIRDGAGGESYLRALRAKADGLPVEFLPPVYDRHAFAAVLQSAHYYCYPSLAEKGESFPVAPLEAMATGLMPIVSNLTCFRDLMTHDVNGLVFDHRGPLAVERLARALRQAASDPQKTAAMGRRAAEHAAQFSCSRIAETYLEDFALLLSDKSRRTAPNGRKDCSRKTLHPLPNSKMNPRLRTLSQENAYSSPWPLGTRLRGALWFVVWLFLFRPAPTPLVWWRLLLLRIFGAHVTGKPFVASSAIVKMPWNLTLEDRACIGPGVEVYNLGPITLKARCTIAQHVYLCGGTHDFTRPELPLVVGDIIVEEDAFVGARAFIMPGVTIGEGAVIGACSVVTRDMPPWTIAAGSPCKPEKPREFARPADSRRCSPVSGGEET